MKRLEIQLFSNDTLGYNVLSAITLSQNHYSSYSFFFPCGVSDGDAEFSQNNL